MTDSGQAVGATTGSGESRDIHFSGIWVGAVLLAAVWHLILFGFSARPATRGTAWPVVPAVTYLPLPVDNTVTGFQRDVRAVWSPILFSLPSAVGFSHAALTNRIGFQPPLEIPPAAPFYLHRAASEFEPIALSAGGIATGAMTGLPRSVPAGGLELPALAMPVTSTGATLQVELSGSFGGGKFVDMRVPVDVSVMKEKPWEVSAFVKMNDEGRVVHAFLETPSPLREVNALLVRTLLAWRLQKPGAVRDGRVVFRYSGAPQYSMGAQGVPAP